VAAEGSASCRPTQKQIPPRQTRALVMTIPQWRPVGFITHKRDLRTCLQPARHGITEVRGGVVVSSSAAPSVRAGKDLWKSVVSSQ